MITRRAPDAIDGNGKGSVARTHGAARGLERFEGFTDAVFAIILTLLIVEVKPPGSPDGTEAGASLWRAISEQWREHLALLLSWLAVGVYWLQHNYSGRLYDKNDHWFGAINLGFLLAVGLTPYPVRVWCFYLGTEHERTASVLLAAALAAPAIFWMAKWLYALPQRRLIDDRLSADFIGQMTRRYTLTALGFVTAVPVALTMPRLGVGLGLTLLLYLLLPQPRPRYETERRPDEEASPANG